MTHRRQALNPDTTEAPASAFAASAAKSQSAAELFKVAAALREKAEFAVASVRDEAKRLMIAEDARKPKPTTEPGRLLRRAEHAEARADAEARREAERAAKAAEKARKEAARVAEKAAKEEALAEEKARKEAARVAEKAEKERALAEEKARKEAARVAEKAAKERALAEEKARKEEEKEKAALARRAAEEARIAEKAEKEAARVAEKARREAERVAEKARKEAEKEAARLARETALAEAEKEKEAARAARESALAEAKARREAASDAERAAREAEKRRRDALRSETETSLTNDLVRFLLKHPRSNRDAVVNAFVDSKRQELQDSEKREYATKAFVRARVALVAEAPANPNDPLRYWRITAFGLEAAGLTSDEAEALRPKVELTSEERLLVEKKKRNEARKAEEEKKEANAKKQASVLKGFFATAPKRALVPQPAVFAAPKPLALDENAERAFVEAVSNGGGGACGTASSDFLRRWKAARRTERDEASRSSTRWGARRGAKRNRDAGETNAENADAATRLAIERSLADVDASASRDGFSSFANVAADPPLNAAKRRKLISVDCSSEYRDVAEDGRETTLQYRFGFQLGLEQLDSPSELRKTFPVPGGRPAFWGSWGASRAAPFVDGTSKAVKEGDTERREVTGRRPFARDARVAYLDDAGALFDSGDEWDEPEDGERLDGSDVDDEDDECAPRSDDTDDEQTEGFVVPDGYLSAEENVCGAEALADDEMDVDDVSDDDQDARGLRRSPENEFSEDEAREAAETKRARAQLTQWMDRARRQNKPLVIASFAEYAEDSSKSSSKDDPATPEPKTSDQNAHLLAALASSRFRRGGGPASQHARGPAVRLYAPPPSAEELCAADAARVAEERRLKEEERARLASLKAEEKRRREEERERLRLAREAAAAAAADERARKEEERLAKKAEKEAAKAEKESLKAAKAAAKAEKESLKAAKAAAKAAKGGAEKVASTPAKTSLDGAVGAEARVAKVSPIKSLFERAAAANLKSAAPGGSIAAAPEGEDGKQ